MGELERVQVVACEDGEDAVEAGGLVDYEGEGDEFGGGTQGDEVEEGLYGDVRAVVGLGMAGRLVPIRGAGLWDGTYPWFGKAQDGRHGVYVWRLCSCRVFALTLQFDEDFGGGRCVREGVWKAEVTFGIEVIPDPDGCQL